MSVDEHATPRLTLNDLTPDQLAQVGPCIAAAMAEHSISGTVGVGVDWIAPARDGLSRCTGCGCPEADCPISDDDAEWTTDANGNHDGLCCEDCWHPNDTFEGPRP